MCCICVCLTIVLLCVLLIVCLMRRPKTKNSLPTQDKNESYVDLELERVGFPRNITEFLQQKEQLCSSAVKKPESDEFGGPAHIYIIKANANLTKEQACGVESILRLFPDKTIFLIDFYKQHETKLDRCKSPPDYLGLLLYLYKDRLEVVAANKDVFFKKTPLQNLTNSEAHFEFLAMLLTAYRFGGYVVSPDIVMTKRYFVNCLPEKTIVEPFTILTPRTCDDFLHYLMQSLLLCNVQHNNLTLDDILTQSIELYSKTSSWPEVKRLDEREVCYSAHDPSGTFLKIRRPENPKCGEEDPREVCELSKFCKQVVQAFLGIKMNQIDVEEETKKVKQKLMSERLECAVPKVTEVEESSTDTSKVVVEHKVHSSKHHKDHKKNNHIEKEMEQSTEHGTDHHTEHEIKHHPDHKSNHHTEKETKIHMVTYSIEHKHHITYTEKESTHYSQRTDNPSSSTESQVEEDV